MVNTRSGLLFFQGAGSRLNVSCPKIDNLEAADLKIINLETDKRINAILLESSRRSRSIKLLYGNDVKEFRFDNGKENGKNTNGNIKSVGWVNDVVSVAVYDYGKFFIALGDRIKYLDGLNESVELTFDCRIYSIYCHYKKIYVIHQRGFDIYVMDGDSTKTFTLLRKKIIEGVGERSRFSSDYMYFFNVENNHVTVYNLADVLDNGKEYELTDQRSVTNDEMLCRIFLGTGRGMSVSGSKINTKCFCGNFSYALFADGSGLHLLKYVDSYNKQGNISGFEEMCTSIITEKTGIEAVSDGMGINAISSDGLRRSRSLIKACIEEFIFRNDKTRLCNLFIKNRDDLTLLAPYIGFIGGGFLEPFLCCLGKGECLLKSLDEGGCMTSVIEALEMSGNNKLLSELRSLLNDGPSLKLLEGSRTDFRTIKKFIFKKDNVNDITGIDVSPCNLRDLYAKWIVDVDVDRDILKACDLLNE